MATPTVAQALAAIVVSVNRVTGVYEKELSIRLQLVANNNLIVFTDAGTDPFTGNNNPNVLINESQTVIDSNIGNSFYDIGHTFSTGAGGLADLAVVCWDFDGTDGKAMGVTGLSNPVGDPYDIDYVAHEMGHEFGGEHTFNSKLGACNGNGVKSSNAEPGSGSTIMAYAGICNSDDLQPHSDPQFHAISFNEITNYTINSDGNSCAVITSTGNTAPIVNAGADYVIPKSTPFLLTGSATDADGDALSYSWEQVDVGGNYSAWNNPSGTKAPLFRSFQPVVVPYRYFPKLSDVVNATTTVGEILPSAARTMNFRLTARDNKAGGGGVNFDEMVVTVDNNGPFTVTYPTATGINWTGNDTRTVTWNVASTNVSPVNTANVAIQLSTDGGYTYPTTLLASTPNDGSADITVPNISTVSARIRVMSVGNVFYNISQNNFTIASTLPVSWVNFYGEKNNNTSKLFWSVNEINIARYEIERSVDGINFASIGESIAKTDNVLLHEYVFNDSKPIPGTNYYRIKQYDKDGKFTYSSIVKLQFSEIGSSWTIFPNPAREIVNVISKTNSAKTHIQLIDASGKVVIDKFLTTTMSGQKIPLATDFLSRGVYSLKIRSGVDFKVEKIILE